VTALRGVRALLVAGCALLSSAALGADVQLANGWMRPAAAGQASVDAYVDIRSDTPLTLIAVTTPVARRVDLVAGTMTDNDYKTKVVPVFDVPAGRELRFALRGNVLRLVDIKRSLGNADPVPLRFEFRDANQREVIATTQLQVRGLIAPQPSPPPPAGASAAADAPKPMR